jgi:hypothetical protein
MYAIKISSELNTTDKSLRNYTEGLLKGFLESIQKTAEECEGLTVGIVTEGDTVRLNLSYEGSYASCEITTLADSFPEEDDVELPTGFPDLCE